MKFCFHANPLDVNLMMKPMSSFISKTIYIFELCNNHFLGKATSSSWTSTPRQRKANAALGFWHQRKFTYSWLKSVNRQTVGGTITRRNRKHLNNHAICYWNENVLNLTKFSSLATPIVVIKCSQWRYKVIPYTYIDQCPCHSQQCAIYFRSPHWVRCRPHQDIIINNHKSWPRCPILCCSYLRETLTRGSYDLPEKRHVVQGRQQGSWMGMAGYPPITMTS